MIKNILIFMVLCFLIGCAKKFTAPNENQAIIKMPKKEIVKTETKAYIATKDANNKILSTKVNINAQKITLIDSITKIIPELNIIANDNNVALSTVINVRANNITLKDYLKQLEKLTGYKIMLVNNNIVVKSKISKSWNLATLANLPNSNIGISSLDKSSNNNINIQEQSNEWQLVIDNVKLLLNDKKANLLVNKRLGRVTVIGTPNQIAVVDKYLSELQFEANRQIALEIKVINVALDKSAANGIDFSLLSRDANRNFGISGALAQTVDGGGVLSIGDLSGLNPLKNGNVELSVLLNYLNKTGTAEIINEPFITLTNGMSTYFSGGNTFKFVSNIKASTDQNGNVIQTAELEDKEIGVQLSLNVKLLDNDKVLIQILPVISSIDSFTTITTGTGDNQQTFQTPNTSLQNLLTQVIVENGKTIVIGGLITKRIISSAKATNNKLFAWLDSDKKEYERKELVIAIKPTILN